MVALRVSVFLALLGMCLAAAPLETQTRAVDEFHTVHVGVPFNVLITPGDKYQVEVTAEKPVVDAITSSVTSGVLKIGVDRVKSEEDIKVTVTLPNSNLKSIQTNSVATTFIAPGFTAKEFTASNEGVSNLYADGITVDKLTLDSRGVSTMKVRGSIGSTTMTASGTSHISLAKVKGPVQARATGVSEIFVEADPNSAAEIIITGTAQGVSTVQHAGGRCALSTSFTSTCKQVAARTLTMKPVEWTRGINVIYDSSCEGAACVNISP